MKNLAAFARFKPGPAAPGARRWVRLGAWGLGFFALKGLAWLVVPLLAVLLA